MHFNGAPLSWYTPVGDGPKYSKCLLCDTVHVGTVSQSGGSSPRLILKSVPLTELASADLQSDTPPELAHTHLVCPQGPIEDLHRITGVYALSLSSVGLLPVPPSATSADAEPESSASGAGKKSLPAAAAAQCSRIQSAADEAPEVVLPLTSKRKRSACSSDGDVSEVSKADGGAGLKQKQSVESFGTPYLLLGRPPSRDEPEEIGDRRESQSTAAGKLVNAIEAFLTLDRLKRPFSPERMRTYRECYNALHHALREVEAQEDTLAREEITQAGLVGRDAAGEFHRTLSRSERMSATHMSSMFIVLREAPDVALQPANAKHLHSPLAEVIARCNARSDGREGTRP
ncbi:hypothetical protein FKP32DRAFT_250805 [Trametes sanguinea]|nr:hypothetical protein FKP32DRAFT_250805 [Trametes sanguinea]